MILGWDAVGMGWGWGYDIRCYSQVIRTAWRNLSKSPGDLLDVIYHPDKLRQIYHTIRMTFGWHSQTSITHTLVSHPDEITYFKFSQLAVFTTSVFFDRLWTDILGISCGIALRWMCLVQWLGAIRQQVITWTDVDQILWHRQAASHYMNRCWPNSMTPYGVIRSQRVRTCLPVQTFRSDIRNQPMESGYWSVNVYKLLGTVTRIVNETIND